MAQNLFIGSGTGNNSGNEPPNNVAVGGAADPTVTLPVATAKREGQQVCFPHNGSYQ